MFGMYEILVCAIALVLLRVFIKWTSKDEARRGDQRCDYLFRKMERLQEENSELRKEIIMLKKDK